MARKNQKLINYHTSGVTVMPALSDLELGEIAIRHNSSKPELIIHVSGASDGLATFIDSGAIHTVITGVNSRVTSLSSSTATITGNLQTQITNLQNSVTATTGSVQTAIDAALAEAKEYTDSEVEGVNSIVTGHTTQISNLQAQITKVDNNVGMAISGVTDVSAITSNLQSQVTAAKGAADAAQEDVTELSGATSAFSASVVTQLNSKVATTAFTSATGTLNTNINHISGWVITNETTLDGAVSDIGELSGTVATLTGSNHSHANKTVLDGIDATDIEHWDLAYESAHTHTNKSVLDTITTAKTAAWDSAKADAVSSSKTYTDAKIGEIVGSDTGKTIRTIANEELAAQLIPSGAQDSLDTLQEIADWIQSHPDDAAAMNSKIGDLSAITEDLRSDLSGYATTGTVNAINGRLTTAEGDIEALQSATGTLNSSITAVTSKINGLSGVTSAFSASVITQLNSKVATTAFTSATGSLSSQITAVDNKLTGYTTTATTDALADRVTSAEGDIDTLQSQVEALEGSNHTHANKTVLDTISATTVTKANAAVTAATVDNQAAVGVVASVSNNSLTLNFDNIVIDCGEF